MSLKRGVRFAMLPSALAIALGSAVPTVATTLRFLTLEQLVEGASEIVEGRVVDVTPTRLETGEIRTAVVMEVKAPWKGSPPRALRFWTYGGRIGSQVCFVPGSPSFRPDERVVLFLTPSRKMDRQRTVFGMVQGVFRISDDPVLGKPMVRVPFPLALATPENGSMERLRALDTLRERVRALAEGSEP